MKCPTCGKENDARALFCDACGAVLSARTAGRQTPPEHWGDLRQRKRRPSALSIAAQAMVVSLCFSLLMAILLPAMSPREPCGGRISCSSNLKQLSISVLQYSQDCDDYFPLAGTWTADVYPYHRNTSIYVCPSTGSQPTVTVYGESLSVPIETDYAFNAALSGFPLSKVEAADRVLLFESEGVSAGGLPHLMRPGRHNGGNFFAFVDGDVKWFEDGSLRRKGVRWYPMKRIVGEHGGRSK